MRKSKGLHIRRKIHKRIYSNITLMLNKKSCSIGGVTSPSRNVYNKEKDDAAWDVRFPCN